MTAFTPLGIHPPLFFLHIPKTSGSAQNALLGALYGDGAVLHAEAYFSAIRDGKKAPMQADCVSGHIPLAAWRAAGPDYPSATMLRDPWARLVSHINWMDRFNHGIDPETRARLSPSHTRIAEALAETDMDDRGSLTRLHATLTESGDDTLFDNLQTRMLLPEKPRAAMTEDDLDAAAVSLAGFALIGFAHAQAAFASALARHSGQPAPAHAETQVNAARSHRLSPENANARDALAPWHRHDAALVDRAAQLPGAARPGLLTRLRTRLGI